MRIRIALGGALLLLAAVAALAFANPLGSSADAHAASAVVRGDIASSVDLTGSVVAPSDRVVSFATAGSVARVSVAEGDRVQAGRVLAQLDLTSLNAQLVAAKSAESAARKRLTADSDAGMGDTVKQADQAAVDDAHARVVAVQQSIDGAQIVAPFGGTVVDIGVSDGAYVTGTPAISGTALGAATAAAGIEVADLDHLRVDVQASEIDVVKVRTGQAATIAFDALDGVSLRGHVCEIGLVGRQVQGVISYPVGVCLDETNASVRPGMSATATVALDRHDGVLLVPSQAVRLQGTQHVVDVVAADGSVSTTAVTVGITDGTRTEIRSGVSEGQRVALPGP